jgi:hypothetical protein
MQKNKVWVSEMGTKTRKLVNNYDRVPPIGCQIEIIDTPLAGHKDIQ